MLIETVEPTADVGGNYGAAVWNRDGLPGHRFIDGWCKIRRASVYLEGPGGLSTVESDEIRRVELGSDDEGPSGKAHRKTLCTCRKGVGGSSRGKL